jgi:hypothetical protein
MCFICLNACCFIIQSGCYISAKFVNRKSGVTVWYQSQGFDTEPGWASGVVFGPRVRGEIVSGGLISDPGMVQSVKELPNHAFKIIRYSSVVKPQQVWYMATRREDSTPVVLEPWDVFRREVVIPRDFRIGKKCTGFKKSFGVTQEHGNRDTRTPENPKN